MLTLGFSAGLPLLLVLGTLSFRLREAGIDRSTIGHLSWVGLAGLQMGLGAAGGLAAAATAHPRAGAAALVAAVAVPGGGRLVGMALTDPRQALGPVVACALMVAFASATQDIALDAFRIESADANHQAALAAAYQRATGWR